MTRPDVPVGERDVWAELQANRLRIDEGDVEIVAGNVGPFAPTGALSRWRWMWLVAAAIAGVAIFATVAGHGSRSAVSYLGGLSAAVAAFEFGAVNIRLVDRYAPELTLAAAMFSYLVTALALALILAASSPRVVDPTGVAVGLGVGINLWLCALLLASRVRQESD